MFSFNLVYASYPSGHICGFVWIVNFVFLLGGIFLAFYLGMIVALGFRLESGNFEKKKSVSEEKQRRTCRATRPRDCKRRKQKNQNRKQMAWSTHSLCDSSVILAAFFNIFIFLFFVDIFCFVAIFCLLLTDAVSNSDHYGLWKNGTLWGQAGKGIRNGKWLCGLSFCFFVTLSLLLVCRDILNVLSRPLLVLSGLVPCVCQAKSEEFCLPSPSCTVHSWMQTQLVTGHACWGIRSVMMILKIILECASFDLEFLSIIPSSCCVFCVGVSKGKSCVYIHLHRR